jgi:GGDEF domain-containing protein
MDVFTMNLRFTDRLSPVLEPHVPTNLVCFTSQIFHFFLDRELVEAERYGNYTAFLLFRIDEADAHSDHGAIQELIKCVSGNIRETDYLGSVDSRTIGVILKNATVESTARVVERLGDEISLCLTHDERATEFEISSAVYPTEANTYDSLTSLASDRLEGKIH